MHKFVERTAAICIAMLFLLSSQVWAMPDIMKLDEVQPGMQGTAYTVVDATGEIKTFHVEIITVLDAGKGESKMIIARLSGPVIEAADGLASGMSGSPVSRFTDRTSE